MKAPFHSILVRRIKKASRQVLQNVPFGRTDPHLKEDQKNKLKSKQRREVSASEGERRHF